MKVVTVRRADRPRYQARIAALERLATYPLGADAFRLDHGPDYFAFFDRLGDVHYLAALEGDRVVAVGCGVLRRVPPRQGARAVRAWYGCDMKVHPEHRGQRIPLRMVRSVFLPYYLRCPRGYGISMDPGDGAPNPVVRLLGHWRWSPIRVAARLGIYSLDAGAMRAAEPVVARHRGPVSYLSLRGLKDVVLRSTGQPMPLLHVQFAPAAPGPVPAPVPEHVHMVCAPLGDPLERDLSSLGLRPQAVASVVAHRMGESDFRFVLTSEI